MNLGKRISALWKRNALKTMSQSCKFSTVPNNLGEEQQRVSILAGLQNRNDIYLLFICRIISLSTIDIIRNIEQSWEFIWNSSILLEVRHQFDSHRVQTFSQVCHCTAHLAVITLCVCSKMHYMCFLEDHQISRFTLILWVREALLWCTTGFMPWLRSQVDQEKRRQRSWCTTCAASAGA